MTDWAWFDLVLAALVLVWTPMVYVYILHAYASADFDSAVPAKHISLQAASWLWEVQLAAASCWCHVACAVGLIIGGAGLLAHAPWSRRWALWAALGYLLLDVASVVVGWALGGCPLPSLGTDNFVFAAGYLTVWLYLLWEVLELRSDEGRLAMQGAERQQVL